MDNHTVSTITKTGRNIPSGFNSLSNGHIAAGADIAFHIGAGYISVCFHINSYITAGYIATGFHITANSALLELFVATIKI